VDDTAPALSDVIRSEPEADSPAGLGPALDLTDALVVVVVRSFDGEVIYQGSATVVDGPSGVVSVDLHPLITSEPGLYDVSWIVVFTDMTQRTFPMHEGRTWLLVEARSDAGDGS
jgi:hypothetical protein